MTLTKKIESLSAQQLIIIAIIIAIIIVVAKNWNTIEPRVAMALGYNL